MTRIVKMCHEKRARLKGLLKACREKFTATFKLAEEYSCTKCGYIGKYESFKKNENGLGYICPKCNTINFPLRTPISNKMTATTSVIPAEAKKDIDKEPKKYKGKTEMSFDDDKRKSGLDETSRAGGETGYLADIANEEEEPNWSNRFQAMIDSARKDGYEAWVIHKGIWHGYYETKEKVKFSAEHGETFHHNEAKKMHRFSFMPEYAEMGIAFLTEGEYEQNGTKYFYPWEVIEANKDTYKGRQFYTEHAEKAGEEIGEIKNTFTQMIDGKNWLCATVKIPEANFTQDYLERAENGLIKEYSTGHRYDYKTRDGKKVITKIYGDEVSSTWRGLVPGTKTLFVKRHIKPQISMNAEKRERLKGQLTKR